MNNDKPLITFRNGLIAAFFIFISIALMAINNNLPTERPTLETFALKDGVEVSTTKALTMKLGLATAKWKIRSFGVFKMAVGQFGSTELTFLGLPDGMWYLHEVKGSN